MLQGWKVPSASSADDDHVLQLLCHFRVGFKVADSLNGWVELRFIYFKSALVIEECYNCHLSQICQLSDFINTVTNVKSSALSDLSTLGLYKHIIGLPTSPRKSFKQVKTYSRQLSHLRKFGHRILRQAKVR